MTLLQMSLMGGMMVLAFALLRLAAGKYLPRRAFLWMWTAAVCRLLLPVKIGSRWSVFQLLSMPAQTTAPSAGSPTGQITGTVVDKIPPVEITYAVSRWETVWLAGVVLLTIYLASAWLYWQIRFRCAVPLGENCWQEEFPLRRSLAVREMEGLRTPLTCGILRPVILLPAGQGEADAEQLRCILTHEYVHIRRFDALRKLFLAIVLIVHWFNPAVWLLFHLASRDMELYCDEQALCLLGEQRRKIYALTLLMTAEQGRAEIPLCNFFGKTMIEERIVMMKEKNHITVFAAVLAVLLLVGVTTAFATTAAEPDSDEQYRVSAGLDEAPYQGSTETGEEIVAVGEPLAAQPNTLVWPVEGADTITVPFGRENPITGVKLDHITIAGERGADIFAAAGGTVTSTGFRNDWGNYLEIDHGDGLVTFYTHCDEVFAAIDDNVEQGEVVASLGQTGMATGPCLGFYVSSNGVPVEPVEWFGQ